MKRNKHVFLLTLNGLLITLALVIPQIAPSLRFEPFFSFTLASHVPVFIAMFLGPQSALFVALGSGFGFLFSTGNMIITARAFSHVVFATLGALFLKKHRGFLDKTPQRFLFNFVLGCIHGICEFLVVIPFASTRLNFEFLVTMFLFLGLGTIVHSMIDFEISYRVGAATFLKKDV